MRGAALLCFKGDATLVGLLPALLVASYNTVHQTGLQDLVLATLMRAAALLCFGGDATLVGLLPALLVASYKQQQARLPESARGSTYCQVGHQACGSQQY